jgi:hypothetical protein
VFEGCPNEPTKSGQQGVVRLHCPNAQTVRKIMPFKSAIALVDPHGRGRSDLPPQVIAELRSRVDRMCGELMPRFNEVAVSNSAILRSTCSVACPDPSPDGAHYKLVIDQQMAEGPSFLEHLRALEVAASSRAGLPDSPEQVRDGVTCLALQVISAIDALYRKGLYHNDLHAHNIIVRDATKTVPMRFAIGGMLLPLHERKVNEPLVPNQAVEVKGSSSDGAAKRIAWVKWNRWLKRSVGMGGPIRHGCPFHVALIDYGLATADAPLGFNYQPDPRISKGFPPLHDLCQFYSSIRGNNFPTLERAGVTDGLRALFSPVCRNLGFTRASSGFVWDDDEGRDGDPTGAYQGILDRAIAAANQIARKTFPPATISPLPAAPIQGAQAALRLASQAAAAAVPTTAGHARSFSRYTPRIYTARPRAHMFPAQGQPFWHVAARGGAAPFAPTARVGATPFAPTTRGGVAPFAAAARPFWPMRDSPYYHHVPKTHESRTSASYARPLLHRRHSAIYHPQVYWLR